MTRLLALGFLLIGCSQAEQAEPSNRQKREAERVYDEIAMEIIAERSPTPVVTPRPWPKPDRSIEEIRFRAVQSAQRARDYEEAYQQQERQRLEARIRRLEEAQINAAQ